MLDRPRMRSARRGAGSSETILLVVGVAIAVLLAVTLFGRKIASMEKNATAALDGKSGPGLDAGPGPELHLDAPPADSGTPPGSRTPAVPGGGGGTPSPGGSPQGGPVSRAIDGSGAMPGGQPAAGPPPAPAPTPPPPAPAGSLFAADPADRIVRSGGGGNSFTVGGSSIAAVHEGTTTNPRGAAYAEVRSHDPGPAAYTRIDLRAEILFENLSPDRSNEQLIESLSDLAPEERRAVEAAFNARYQVGAGGSDLRTMLRQKFANNRDIRLANQILDAPGAVLSRRAVREQIERAVRNQESRTRRRVTTSRPRTDLEIAALELHLSSYGAQFTNAAVRNVPTIHYTGREYALKTAIEQRFATQGTQLTPGDVFEESLRLHGGDVYQALLGAHNLLRAMARGADPGLESQGPASRIVIPNPDGSQTVRITGGNFGTNRDDGWFDRYLVDIHGGSLEDEGGSWYHMFGTAASAHVVGETVTNLGVAWGERGAYEDYTQGDPLKARLDYLGSDFGARLPD